jgi:hypothetical protein
MGTPKSPDKHAPSPAMQRLLLALQDSGEPAVGLPPDPQPKFVSVDGRLFIRVEEAIALLHKTIDEIRRGNKLSEYHKDILRYLLKADTREYTKTETIEKRLGLKGGTFKRPVSKLVQLLYLEAKIGGGGGGVRLTDDGVAMAKSLSPQS